VLLDLIFAILIKLSRALPEFTEEELQECLADDRRSLQDARVPIGFEQPTLPFSYGAEKINYNELSLNRLITIRETHQTRHASHSVRTSQASTQPTNLSPGSSNTAHVASLRRSIVQSFYANLKQVQPHSASTGKARAARWKEGQGGSGDEIAKGNAGNAAAVAAEKAREVRKLLF
jgi:hypothetical protein